jgi:hypothetical protein
LGSLEVVAAALPLAKTWLNPGSSSPPLSSLVPAAVSLSSGGLNSGVPASLRLNGLFPVDAAPRPPRADAKAEVLPPRPRLMGRLAWPPDELPSIRGSWWMRVASISERHGGQTNEALDGSPITFMLSISHINLCFLDVLYTHWAHKYL